MACGSTRECGRLRGRRPILDGHVPEPRHTYILGRETLLLLGNSLPALRKRTSATKFGLQHEDAIHIHRHLGPCFHTWTAHITMKNGCHQLKTLHRMDKPHAILSTHVRRTTVYSCPANHHTYQEGLGIEVRLGFVYRLSLGPRLSFCGSPSSGFLQYHPTSCFV